jgi:tRNA (guanine37-N1)-methyltransferase
MLEPPPAKEHEMTFAVQLVTIFPEFFDSPLSTSLMGKAIDKGLFEVDAFDIREYATDKHRTTDDVPYGGGAGMVMKCEPTVAALEAAAAARPGLPRIYMTPQGEPFTQSVARELAQGPGMVLLCGRYEGVDYRVREGWIDREICVGDFVLTGGEPAALVVLNAVTRLLPGVLGNAESIDDESFSSGMLEYPHYTRPREFRGREVPEVLLSGHHARIEAWRREQSLRRTQAVRPDLLARAGEEE